MYIDHQQAIANCELRTDPGGIYSKYARYLREIH